MKFLFYFILPYMVKRNQNVACLFLSSHFVAHLKELPVGTVLKGHKWVLHSSLKMNLNVRLRLSDKNIGV